MKKMERNKMFYSIVIGIVVLIFVIAIFDSWNDMWYQFGEHVYKWLH